MKFWEWLRGLFGRPAQRVATAHPPATAAVVTRRRAPLAGDLLQFPQASPTSTTDIVIGFDFGTSCSKVAIQSPYKLGGRVVIVGFGDLAHPVSAHLLPAALFVANGGELGLKAAGGVAAGKWHLKVPLLDGATPSRDEAERDSIAWAAAYVGLVLREARRFFLTTEADNFGRDTLRWAMNLGIPSAGYDDAAVRQRFLSVARAGWLLSLRQSPPTLATAHEALERIALGPPEGVDIDVIPEVAAQVVGYAKSRQRRDGLHLLLDVGASTLDLCAFCLHEVEGDDSYELLTADVQPLGLLELHRRRVSVCNGKAPFSGIPDDLVQALPDLPEVRDEALPLEPLRACDREFAESARRVLIRTMMDLRKRRDPHSPRWSDGLPVFICGGGSTSRVVREVVRLADSTARRAWTPYAGIKAWALPVPSNVVSAAQRPSMDFGRVSVAYGLSFPGINIGKIEPPSEIEDIRLDRPQRDWQAGYVDKSQV